MLLPQHRNANFNSVYSHSMYICCMRNYTHTHTATHPHLNCEPQSCTVNYLPDNLSLYYKNTYPSDKCQYLSVDLPLLFPPPRRRRASSSFKHNTSFVARLPTIRRHKSQTIQTPGGGDGGGVSKPPGSSRASTRYTRTIRDINASVENLGKLVGNRAAPSDFRLCFPFPFHCEFLFAHSPHAHTHTDSF